MEWTTHELAAALRMLLRGNGNVLERLGSPFQLVDGPAARALRKVALRSVGTHFARHYQGFFAQTRRALSHGPITAKGALYAYRVALTGIFSCEPEPC